MKIPTIEDVRDAREAIRPYLQPTPLHPYPSLSRLVGADVWVKHENHLPVGAFKVRGGVNLISRLSEDERRRGVVAASTGNHGLSVAFGAKTFGVRATIFVPSNPNPVKAAAIRDLGAEVVEHGRDYDDAKVRCEEVAAQTGARYVDSGNEPLLIAGVATSTLEMLEMRPDVDVIVVPIGGGSGAAGACIVAKSIRPDIEVIGVQSEQAPAAYNAWRERRLVHGDEMRTTAEGLATRNVFELPQRILWEHLDDFVLVPDDEIWAAVRTMIECTRNLVEPAGAAPLAAALRLRDRVAGRTVALVCSGGNITVDQLREVIR